MKSKYTEPVVIAEIGCNHKGSMDIAREMIDVAKVFCKVKHVKFQKRNNKELLSKEQYNAPHPEPFHSYGDTYGAHREYLELDIEQHKELKEYCDKNEMYYGCSVWDMTSLKEMISINPSFIKIPSALNTNYQMLDYICDNYQGEIHLSFGMTTRDEEHKIVELVSAKNRLGDFIPYSCTSGYPVPPEDVCLLEILRIKEAYEEITKGIGFSGHHNGISIDVAAFTLGANYIERHFTLDRTWKGTDHAASLEPDGLRRLNKNVSNVQKSLSYKSEEILPIEAVQRKKLKWRG